MSTEHLESRHVGPHQDRDLSTSRLRGNQSGLFNLPFEVRRTILEYVVGGYIFHINRFSTTSGAETSQERLIWRLSNAICIRSFEPGTCCAGVEQVRRLLLHELRSDKVITHPAYLIRQQFLECSYWCYDFRHKLYPRPAGFLTLPLTCRQFRADWEAAFYSSCVFILAPNALTQFALSISPLAIQSIRYLQITLWLGYGFQEQGANQDATDDQVVGDVHKTDCQLLVQRFTGLSELDITLRIESVPGSTTNRWSQALRSKAPIKDAGGWGWTSAWEQELAPIQPLLILASLPRRRINVALQLQHNAGTAMEQANLEAWRQIIEESLNGNDQADLRRWMQVAGRSGPASI